MIDYRHRLIFIHVPRTAGTSILKACGRAGLHHDWRIEHASWRIYKVHFPDLWETFRKVAVHRDRADHRRSWYHHHREWLVNCWQPHHYRHYACTYEEWERRGCPVHEDWTQCGIDGDPLDQTAFTGPESEGVQILRFENIGNEWRAFCAENNLPGEWWELPHENASENRDRGSDLLFSIA